MSANERRWVLPRLTEAPEGARRPVDWLFLLVVGVQVVAMLLYVLASMDYYHALQKPLAVYVFGLAGVWYVWEMVPILLSNGEPAPDVWDQSEPLVLKMEGLCNRSGPAEVPLFRGLPCLLPPGWELRFPDGPATFEVVAGRDPKNPIEDSAPFGDGWFWVVVGMGSEYALDAEVARGLPLARPGTLRRQILTASILGLATLTLGLSGPTWGLRAWSGFLRGEFAPVELQTKSDMKRPDLRPGREILIPQPFPLADAPEPPGDDPTLVAVGMPPDDRARGNFQAILDSLDKRIQARERWLGGDMQAEREVRLQRLLAGPDASLAGNHTWDMVQLELWASLSAPLDDDYAEFEAKFRLNAARQAMRPEVLNVARTWEKPILDTLAAQAVAALQEGAKPIWIRGLEVQYPGPDDISVTDSFAVVRERIMARFPTTPPVFAVLSEHTRNGWIAVNGGRGVFLSWLVSGWVGLSLLLVIWNLGSAWLLSRRYHTYLARLSDA